LLSPGGLLSGKAGCSDGTSPAGRLRDAIARTPVSIVPPSIPRLLPRTRIPVWFAGPVLAALAGRSARPGPAPGPRRTIRAVLAGAGARTMSAGTVRTRTIRTRAVLTDAVLARTRTRASTGAVRTRTRTRTLLTWAGTVIPPPLITYAGRLAHPALIIAPGLIVTPALIVPVLVVVPLVRAAMPRPGIRPRPACLPRLVPRLAHGPQIPRPAEPDQPGRQSS
jgi:hypothetical protein